MELYQRVSLVRDVEEYGLKKGDVATLVEFIDHPAKGEKGCVLEILNALGQTIDIITLPVSSVESLKADEILNVRSISRAV